MCHIIHTLCVCTIAIVRICCIRIVSTICMVRIARIVLYVPYNTHSVCMYSSYCTYTLYMCGIHCMYGTVRLQQYDYSTRLHVLCYAQESNAWVCVPKKPAMAIGTKLNNLENCTTACVRVSLRHDLASGFLNTAALASIHNLCLSNHHVNASM